MNFNRNQAFREELETLTQMVSSTMAWDHGQAVMWMITANPHFGGCSPEDLVFMERGHKVRQFIEAASDENR